MSTTYALVWSLLSLAFVVQCTEKPKHTNNSPRPTKVPEIGNVLGGTIDRPMFVRSRNGLVLRKEPNARSANLAILPFRMQVGEFRNATNCEKIGGVEGCWRQIVTADTTGWIFDGFLEPVKSPMQQILYNRLSEQHCQNIANFCECATKIEKNELKKHPSLSRLGGSITIRLDNGAILSMADVENQSSTRRYRFERRDNDFYIFQVCCWEWSERELVNAKTGKRITTFGEQLFSPDGKHFVSFQDEVFSRNGLEIFEIDGTVPKKVFSDVLTMSEIRWKDSEHIEVLDPNFLNGKVRHIRIKNGKWEVH